MGRGEKRMSEWEKHVMAALRLVRYLRLIAVLQRLDPRAVRVALKYALMVDTYLSKQHGLTSEEDRQLTEIAEDLFKKTPKTEVELYDKR
jgi:hypothetical protein